MTTLSPPSSFRSRVLRLLALALALAGASVATAPEAASAAGAGPVGPQWGIRAALYGKTHLPHDHFTYGLRPGSHLTDGIDLVNYQSRPQTLHVYPADMIPVLGGGFAPAQAYQPMRQIGAWVHITHPWVTVPARAHVLDRFEVAVPRFTPPGDYLGAVVAAARSSGGGDLHIETRAALIVRLAVPGTIALRVGLGTLHADQQSSEERFSLVVQNRGNVTFTYNATLLVHGGEHGVQRIPLGPLDTYVVPGGYTVLHGVWHGAPLIGRITASAVVRALINGKPYRTYTSPTLTITFFPWTQAGAMLVALVALAVLAFTSRRRWQGWLQARREERAALALFRAQRQAEKGVNHP